MKSSPRFDALNDEQEYASDLAMMEDALQNRCGHEEYRTDWRGETAIAVCYNPLPCSLHQQLRDDEQVLLKDLGQEPRIGGGR